MTAETAPPPIPAPRGREIDRILALPKREPLDVERNPKTGLYAPGAEALADIETARYALAPGESPAHDLGRAPGSCRCASMGFPCIKRLFPSQAWFLRELRLHGGALGFLTVAAGKTLCNILAPLASGRCRHAVLLIKPDQRIHYCLNYLRLREHFRVPQIAFHEGEDFKGVEVPGSDPPVRFRGVIIPGMPVLRVIPYSRLSRPESSTLLDEIDFDEVYADEAHCLSDWSSRRTRRFIRSMAKRRGRVVFAPSSGSMIKKKLDDVAHLALFALGGGSPYPLDRGEVERWGAVIDPVRDPDLQSATYRQLRLAFTGHGAAADDPVESLFGGSVGKIREGILRRVVRTPGVISTRVSEATASVTLSEFPVPPMPATIQKLLADVRQRWERPDGEEFQEAAEATACARNVARGFHYYWHFFDDPPAELLAEWRAARKAWCREVRAKVQEDVPKLDSPHLLENAAERAHRVPAYDGPLPIWRSKTWPAWAAIKDKIRYEPRSRWLDDFFARACADWALKHRGIVWYDSTPLGVRVAKLSGLPLHAGGPGAEARLYAERGDRSLIVSLNAHRESRDWFQHHYHRGLVAEPPSSGDAWHQLIGRYCRPGQKEDTVEMLVPLHVEEDKSAMRSAYRYAEFMASQATARHLLLAADTDEAVSAVAGGW